MKRIPRMMYEEVKNILNSDIPVSEKAIRIAHFDNEMKARESESRHSFTQASEIIDAVEEYCNARKTD